MKCFTDKFFFSFLENVPFPQVISKIHNVFSSILFSQALFDHIKYNSVSHTERNFTGSYSYISYGHNLVRQEFPVLVDSYLLVSLHFVSKSSGPICHAT